MKIIPLTKNDTLYIKQLHTIRELDVQSDKLDSFLSNPNNIAYIAVVEDKVVGLVWGYILERMDNESMLYIHSVDVREDYQNQKIGSKMIEAILKKAKELNLRNTFLITDKNNTVANRLYAKFTTEIEPNKVLYVFK